MTRLLRRLFAMPRQADPVQQYQADTAAFVAIIFLAGAAVVICWLLVDAANGQHGMTAETEILIASLGLSALLLPLAALRWGYVRLAGFGLVATAYSAVTAATWLGGAVQLHSKCIDRFGQRLR